MVFEDLRTVTTVWAVSVVSTAGGFSPPRRASIRPRVPQRACFARCKSRPSTGAYSSQWTVPNMEGPKGGLITCPHSTHAPLLWNTWSCRSIMNSQKSLKEESCPSSNAGSPSIYLSSSITGPTLLCSSLPCSLCSCMSLCSPNSRYEPLCFKQEQRNNFKVLRAQKSKAIDKP